MTTQSNWGTVPSTDEFGARLALIRWRMGWNQKEAALACGVPQGSWREWELSGRAPRNLVEVADKISRTTGIDDYWIITGKESHGGGGGKRNNHEYMVFPNSNKVTALPRPLADTVFFIPAVTMAA